MDAGAIEAQLRASGTRARAEHSEGFTPSALRFYGADAKPMRAVARAAARERKGDPAAAIALAQQLVDGGSFDGRQVAYVMFERNLEALFGVIDDAAVLRWARSDDLWWRRAALG